MLTTELESVTMLTSDLEVANRNDSNSLLHQKLVLKLKSEWAQEYLFWKSSIQEYDRISQSGSLKENHGKVKLSILNRKLKDLMTQDFTQIESEIDELITAAHQANHQQIETDFMDRYWDVQNEIQHFRKKARSIQISNLKHVNKHLPLFIF